METLSRVKLWAVDAARFTAGKTVLISPDEAIAAWAVWRDMLDELLERDAELAPEHALWSWAHKAEEARRNPHLYAINGLARTRSSRMEGMAFLTVQGEVAAQSDRPIVYLNYLSAAPWNDRHFVAKPRFRLVGTLLLAQAVQISDNLGYGGRVGLHSLPQAEGFYRRCGMLDYGYDETNRMRYFEFSEETAVEFAGTRLA